MYQIQQFLIGTDERPTNGARTQFKVVLDTCALYEINRPVPIIIPNVGCKGLAVPYELHVSANHTVIFYTKVKMDYPAKVLDAWYKLYQISMGRLGGTGTTNRQDRDTQRTGMDAATRMMIGESRSPRDIADDERYGYGDDDDDDDDHGPSILDFMRQANPGDRFFD